MEKKTHVRIISEETIKPSSTIIHNLQPYKLCFFDQLTPTNYAPLIIFYSKREANVDATQFITHLKKSLSETLSVLYPASGRVRDNMVVDHFDEGAPFLEAQVNCSLSEFLDEPEIESLNQFLPCQPFAMQSRHDVPLAVFQVSLFSCGGIALGCCMSHKLGDGATAAIFFRVWTAISCGSRKDQIVLPNLCNASLMFPPRDQLPQNNVSLVESLWFEEGNYVTRRFVFDAKAIETLRNKAGGESKANPSRIQALSAFLWKCYMATSRAVSSSPRTCFLRQAVNLRPRLKSGLLDGAIGNLFWYAGAAANPESDMELHELTNLINEAVAKFQDQDYLKSLQGDQGFELISKGLNLLEEITAKEKPDRFAITSWSNLHIDGVNVGGWEAVWFAAFGRLGPAFTNFVTLIETGREKGFEAWINLEEKRMAVLENDPEFLAYASPNPKIIFKPAA